MSSEEEKALRQRVRQLAQSLGLLRGRGSGFVRRLRQRSAADAETAKRPERERLDEPGCSRAFNPGGLR